MAFISALDSKDLETMQEISMPHLHRGFPELMEQYRYNIRGPIQMMQAFDANSGESGKLVIVIVTERGVHGLHLNVGYDHGRALVSDCRISG